MKKFFISFTSLVLLFATNVAIGVSPNPAFSIECYTDGEEGITLKAESNGISTWDGDIDRYEIQGQAHGARGLGEVKGKLDVVHVKEGSNAFYRKTSLLLFDANLTLPGYAFNYTLMEHFFGGSPTKVNGFGRYITAGNISPRLICTISTPKPSPYPCRGRGCT